MLDQFFADAGPFVLTDGGIETTLIFDDGEDLPHFAAFHLLRNDLKTDPVLVLDDVFAELDAGRRERLAAMVADAEQVLITAAVAEDVPDILSGRTYYVTKGSVSAEEAEDAPLTESGTTSGSADATSDDGGADHD